MFLFLAQVAQSMRNYVFIADCSWTRSRRSLSESLQSWDEVSGLSHGPQPFLPAILRRDHIRIVGKTLRDNKETQSGNLRRRVRPKLVSTFLCLRHVRAPLPTQLAGLAPAAPERRAV